jgi:hypothetical protein
MDKISVLKFLAFPPDSQIETFNEGRQLYAQCKNKNPGIERDLNRDGYSRERVGTVLYELAKTHGITQKEILVYKAENTKVAERSILERLLDEENLPILYAFKIQKEYPLLSELHPWPDNIDELLSQLKNDATRLGEVFDGEEEEAEGLIMSETLQNRIDEIALPEQLEKALQEYYPGAIAALEINKEDYKGEEDFKLAINEEFTPLTDEQKDLIKNLSTSDVEQPAAPQEETEGKSEYSIRKEYPFLNDAECPNELKILVADKIAAYHRYSEYHAQLREHNAGKLTLTDAKLTELTANAEYEFGLNQAIAKELEFYKENKSVLGEHPIFKELAMQREVDAMSNEEAHRFITSSASFLSRKRKAIREATSDILRDELKVELQEREAKIAYAKKKLGLG